MSYEQSSEMNELATALAVAQGQIENAVKDSANPFFKSSYADLASVWDAVRGPLSANGLAIMQLPSAEGPKVTVTTVLTHKSGQWVRSFLTVTAKEDSPQAVGSAITYARRYALQSVAGVAPEDDDGERAQGRTTATAKNAPKSNAPTGKHTPPQQDVIEKKLRESINDAIAKIQEKYYNAGQMGTFWSIMGSHGYESAAQIPADYEKAKPVIDELKEAFKKILPPAA